MPINSILAEPGLNSLWAAYRPIPLRVEIQNTNGQRPPVVYCDIYFGNVYYKTLSKTMYWAVSEGYSFWEFDIQDAAQEYLKKVLPFNGDSEIVQATGLMTKAFCRFRSSGYDADGFIKPEGIEPIQGTGTKAPVSGDGYQSNEFFIVNATLQHEDNQYLDQHLEAFKKRAWNSKCYPLTHRPDRNYLTVKDSDFFPAIVDSNLCLNYLVLKYRLVGQSTIRQARSSITIPCTATISALTIEQLSATTNVKVSWPAAAGAAGYSYRLDGGVWLAAPTNQITLENLEIGDHTIDVVPVCQCALGQTKTQSFTVQDPVTFVCTSSIENLTASQVGSGAAGIDWDAIGDPPTVRYRIDGGPWITAAAPPIGIENLSAGEHTIQVEPVCANGVSGTSASTTFTIGLLPSIIKLNETSTGPGGIRTQYFQIGANVTAGNKFTLTVYSRAVTVTAIAGDTPSTIAAKLAAAINSTTASQWNTAGSAPNPSTPGFPPYAVATGNNLVIELNYQNSFSYYATMN